MPPSDVSVFSQGKPAPESLALRLLGAAEVVSRVLTGQSLPVALSAVVAAGNLDAATRGTIQDIAYSTIRKLGLVRFLVNKLTRRPPEPVLLQTLLYSALALLVPEKETLRYESYTTVDQAVQAAASHRSLAKAKGLVNAVLRRFLREKAVLLEEAAHFPEAQWNYPVWWIDRLKKTYPQQWQTLLNVGNSTPPLTLRVNRRKIRVDEYCALVKSAGFNAVMVGEWAVKLIPAVPVNRIPGFADGLVSVQDAAAQLAVPLLELRDGMKVLDACAAPGGKTGHLLETADVDLLALDQDANRLKMIVDNLDRLGLKAETRIGDATQSDWWDKTPFDCIVADVPCTASGIVRRHPDIRWLRRPDDARELASVARRILETVWTMLKPGGRLLLATCSIWPEESEQQAQTFASRPGVIRLDAPGQLLPHAGTTDDHDGLFYALFKKT